MNMNKTVILYYINAILSTVGIAASFYVLGWVDHPNHGIIGTTTFILFLGLLLGTVINYNKTLNRTDKD